MSLRHAHRTGRFVFTLAAIGFFGVPAAVLVIGCASDSAQTPPSAIADPLAPMQDRRDAVRLVWDRVEDGTISRDRAQSLLKDVAWLPGVDPGLRLAAVRQLADPRADLADTERVFGLMLPTRMRPPYASPADTGVMAQAAASNNWTSATVPLVRSLSYPFGPDADRPEAAALRSLHPDRPLVDTVWDVFTGPEDGALRERDRRDAWGLLVRLDPTGERLAELATMPAAVTPGGEPDPLLTALRATRSELGVIPLTAAQFEWAERLQGREHDAFRSLARTLIDSLDQDKRRGIAMRHPAGLIWAERHEPELLRASKSELLRAAQSRIEPRRQVWRTSDAVNGTKNESITRNRDALAWGDALLVAIASRIPDAPDLTAAAFELADSDHRDETTEYGGVIDARSDGVLEMLPYPPRLRDRGNDERFVASLDMLRRGDAALFHFHMQANRHRNGDFAGPSLADVQYAERQGRACIVFTFVDRDTLNVDVYFPSGVTIDLGSIERPGSEGS